VNQRFYYNLVKVCVLFAHEWSKVYVSSNNIKLLNFKASTIFIDWLINWLIDWLIDWLMIDWFGFTALKHSYKITKNNNAVNIWNVKYININDIRYNYVFKLCPQRTRVTPRATRQSQAKWGRRPNTKKKVLIVFLARISLMSFK